MEGPTERPWRGERVIIVFRPRLGRPASLRDKEAGDWVVVPANKVLSPGQQVTWQTVPPANLELFLPDVFTQPSVKGPEGSATATVKSDGNIGFFFYEAYCNGQLATAGSSPGVIIDP